MLAEDGEPILMLVNDENGQPQIIVKMPDGSETIMSDPALAQSLIQFPNMEGGNDGTIDPNGGSAMDPNGGTVIDPNGGTDTDVNISTVDGTAIDGNEDPATNTNDVNYTSNDGTAVDSNASTISVVDDSAMNDVDVTTLDTNDVPNTTNVDDPSIGGDISLINANDAPTTVDSDAVTMDSDTVSTVSVTEDTMNTTEEVPKMDAVTENVSADVEDDGEEINVLGCEPVRDQNIQGKSIYFCKQIYTSGAIRS